MTGPSADHWASSLTPVRSSSAAGRTRSKLMSTITSVPPAIARAAGCSALMASASARSSDHFVMIISRQRWSCQGRIPVLLRALAETPDLRLRVLVGEDALDRTVDGVYTTDLLDPRRYLTGGEIVLTGLMWRRRPADSEAFVAAVTAAGDAALGSVPDDLVAACRRHRLPLLEVPVDVSFAAITERVLAARLQPGGSGIAVGRLRELAAGRADPGSGERKPASLAEVLAVAAAEYGVTGHVLSGTGQLVAGGPAAPGPEQRAVLARGWLSAGGLPATVLAGGVAY